MKKVLSLILTITILFTQVLPISVLAADKNSGVNANDGVITISNPIEGKTYSLYKLFELESWNEEKGAYVYTISNSSKWYEFLNSYDGVTLTQRGASDTYIVTVSEGFNVSAFASNALNYAKTNKIDAVRSETAGTSALVFDNLNYGYYLVDSSAGSLCALNTTNSEIEINEKNSIPTIDKTVKKNNSGIYGDSSKEAIGKVIDFRTIINVGEGAENYVLHDVMSSGLTFIDSTLVVKNETTSAELPTTSYTVEYGKSVKYEENSYTTTFTITFNNEFMSTMQDNIVVEYQAKLNENAVIYNSANTNDTWLEYGDNHVTLKDQTKVYTYTFDIVKTDSENIVLEGATFKLYDAKTDGNIVPLVDEGNGVYRVDYTIDVNNSATISAGKVTIKGLDGDVSYFLEEITAPNGYNKLTSRVEFSVADNSDVDAEINENTYVRGGLQIVNTTGSMIPSTGGIGTTLFITIGSIMVLSFGILLVARLRLAKEI